MSAENHLVLSAIGEDRPGIVNELARCCSDYRCNIVDSRMTILGGEFAVLMMISGPWDGIAKLETALPAIARKLDLLLHTKQTQPRRPAATITYSVNVVSLDHPGIVHEIAQFFSERRINIEDLHTSTYCAPHTGTQMFNLNLVINLPANTHLATLREEFMVFCDEINLDAVFEPLRGM